MEKIQSAIAKARAVRDGQPTEENVSVKPAAIPQVKKENDFVAMEVQPDLLAMDARWSGLPLANLSPRLMEKNRFLAFSGGPEATHFDMLRTRLLQHMSQNGWKRIAITSPGPGCGKTTLALNLGFAMSRRPDLRTIISEVDLRRPSIQKVLGQRYQHSFADVLNGKAAFDQNAFRHAGNLAFATNSSATRATAELLHSDTVPEVLDKIEADYDPTCWIFDMPPMLATDDTLAFVGRVDCAILVAAAESTTVKELDKCERELATQTNVIGVVLNKCRYMDRHDSYDYY